MTYNVLMGTLNPTHSLTHSLSGNFASNRYVINSRLLHFKFSLPSELIQELIRVLSQSALAILNWLYLVKIAFIRAT